MFPPRAKRSRSRSRKRRSAAPATTTTEQQQQPNAISRLVLRRRLHLPARAKHPKQEVQQVDACHVSSKNVLWDGWSTVHSSAGERLLASTLLVVAYCLKWLWHISNNYYPVQKGRGVGEFSGTWWQFQEKPNHYNLCQNNKAHIDFILHYDHNTLIVCIVLYYKNGLQGDTFLCYVCSKFRRVWPWFCRRN